MKGSPRVSLTSWIARETISLPTPDSPWIRTEVSLPARLAPTFSSRAATWASPGQARIMSM